MGLDGWSPSEQRRKVTATSHYAHYLNRSGAERVRIATSRLLVHLKQAVPIYLAKSPHPPRRTSQPPREGAFSCGRVPTILTTPPDRSEANKWKAHTLRMFAHPKRLKILFMLRRGKQSGAVMARALGVPDVIILKHLAALCAWDIVIMRREGKRAFYEIAAPEWEAFLTLVLDVAVRHKQSAGPAGTP